MNEPEVDAAVAAYTPAGLAIYDTVALGLITRMVWRCSKAELLALYNRNLSARHMELGVGTGYFLDRASFPDPAPEITLVDLNLHTLAYTARRIQRYRPAVVRANLVHPLPPAHRGFLSVGASFLLHCMPGDIPAKAVVLRSAAAALAPGGRFFGSTILASGVRPNPAARALMALFNRKGVLNNSRDDLGDLDRELSRTFAHHTITVRGCVAIFEATTAQATTEGGA